MNELTKTRRQNVRYINIGMTIFFIILSTSLQISLINNINVWQDEIYTMLLMKKERSSFWQFLIANVQPPLYYLILKPFAILSEYNISVLKLVSILPITVLNLFVSISTLKNKEKSNKIMTGILLCLFIVATSLTYNFLEKG